MVTANATCHGYQGCQAAANAKTADIDGNPPTYHRAAMALSTWPVAALVALMAGALYVRYANPAVGGGNSGEFQVMAPLLGIAHPPSYPLYLLLAKAASLLPLGGDVAWRINVLTALLAAFAVYGAGLLAGALAPRDRVQGSKFRVQSREGGGTHPDSGRGAAVLAAALTAAALAAMPRLWTLAVEAEVFSLHLLLVVVFWLCLVKWLTTRQDRWLLVAGLCAGLGLANHRTF